VHVPLLGGFLLFGALMAIGVGINALAPGIAFATPEIVVAAALFMPRYRGVGLVAGIVVGLGLTAYWLFVAVSDAGSGTGALGASVVIFPLLGAAATLLSFAGLLIRRRPVTFADAD
jgi:hypothetical protein